MWLRIFSFDLLMSTRLVSIICSTYEQTDECATKRIFDYSTLSSAEAIQLFSQVNSLLLW